MKHHHNRFLLIILLTLGLFALLFASMSSVEKKQDLRSKAADTTCRQNIDCPIGTSCVNGVCVLKAISPTQSPLSYANVSQIDQSAKPIPSYFVEPTPTPQPHALLRMAYGINGFLGSFFNVIFSFVDGQLQSVVGNLDI